MARIANKFYQATTLTAAAQAYDKTSDGGSGNLWDTFGLQVTETGGTATSWTVTLQGSLDGSNWSTLTSHQKAVEGNGATVWTTGKPCTFVRAYVTALTIGTATGIQVVFVGKGA